MRKVQKSKAKMMLLENFQIQLNDTVDIIKYIPNEITV